MDDVQRFSELLAVLVRHEVEFVIVGGVAAVLAGAPISTFDLDVLTDCAPANLERLLAALEEIDARYLDPAGREIRPNAERLRRQRMNLLTSPLGRLDVASEIGSGMRFEEAYRRSSEHAVGTLRLRALELDAVIETKEQANRDKDRATLPVLRETLRLRQERSEG